MNVLPYKIVIAFTQAYFVPAATTLLSLAKNLSDGWHAEVICIHDANLTQIQKNRLSEIDQKLRLHFINMVDEDLGIYVNKRYTQASLYRLILPSILAYDVVLYIDTDIIVRSDLSKLLIPLDFDKYYAFAVEELPIGFMEKYIEELLGANSNYFNSGFLLLNLKKLREDNMSRLLLRKADNPTLMFPDQDAFNIVCRNFIAPLAPKYNAIRLFRAPKLEKYFLDKYSMEHLIEVKSHGNIHYVGCKPWNTYTLDFDIWWDYYYKLSSSIRDEMKVSFKMKCLFFLYKITPIRNLFYYAQSKHHSANI